MQEVGEKLKYAEISPCSAFKAPNDQSNTQRVEIHKLEAYFYIKMMIAE